MASWVRSVQGAVATCHSSACLDSRWVKNQVAIAPGTDLITAVDPTDNHLQNGWFSMAALAALLLPAIKR